MAKSNSFSPGNRRRFLRTLSLADISKWFLPRQMLRVFNKATSRMAIVEEVVCATPYSLDTKYPVNTDIVNISDPSDNSGRTDASNLPGKTLLEQNYPNPFNPETTIQYNIAKPGHVVLKVFDLSGREVSILVDSFHNAGVYYARFNGRDLSSGAYICRLQIGDIGLSRKMILVK